GHGAFRTNAMSTVDRLVFDGRIPPALEKEHVAGALKIQPDAPDAVRHQNHMAGGVVAKPRDDIVALLAGNLAMVLSGIKPRESRSHLGERLPPWTDHDRFAPAGCAFLQIGFKPLEFGAR